jgi:hypothetical protein
MLSRSSIVVAQFERRLRRESSDPPARAPPEPQVWILSLALRDAQLLQATAAIATTDPSTLLSYQASSPCASLTANRKKHYVALHQNFFFLLNFFCTLDNTYTLCLSLSLSVSL